MEAKLLLDKDASLERLRECLITDLIHQSKSDTNNFKVSASLLDLTEACDLYQQLSQDCEQYSYAFPNDVIASDAEVLCELSNPRQVISLLLAIGECSCCWETGLSSNVGMVS